MRFTPGIMAIPQAAGAPPVPWVPADLGASLKGWWNADSLADGDVTTWTDSISGIAPTQATAANRPARAATSFNSAYPGVTFDGVSDRLIVSASVAAFPTGTAGSDLYALVYQGEAGSAGAARAICAYGGGASHGARMLQRFPVSTVNRLRVSDATTNLTDTTYDFSGYHMVAGRFDAATATGFLDGRATSIASTAMAFATGTTLMAIGSSVGASFFWLGIIRHIFVTTVLTLADRQKLEGWMAWDSGLASLLDVGHPYKSAAPTV